MNHDPIASVAAAFILGFTTAASAHDCLPAPPTGDAAAPRVEHSRSGPAATLPDVRRWGDTTYLSGGFGKDEARAMRNEKHAYPLALTFSVRHGSVGQLESAVAVEIERPDGSLALSVTSEGPFLLANLQPGAYRISARTKDGRLQRRDVVVSGASTVDVVFQWPEQVAAR